MIVRRSVFDGGKARHRFEIVQIDVIAHVALACIDTRLPVPGLDHTPWVVALKWK